MPRSVTELCQVLWQCECRWDCIVPLKGVSAWRIHTLTDEQGHEDERDDGLADHARPQEFEASEVLRRPELRESTSSTCCVRQALRSMPWVLT